MVISFNAVRTKTVEVINTEIVEVEVIKEVDDSDTPPPKKPKPTLRGGIKTPPFKK